MNSRLGHHHLHRRSHRTAPRLESLEGRRLLTVQVSYDPATDILTIDGDGNASSVVVQDLGTDSSGALTVRVDGTTRFISSISSPVRQVRFDGEGDDDTLTYNLTGNLAVDRRLYLDGDSGVDTLRANVNGDILAGAHLAFEFYGNTGNDRVDLNLFNDVDVSSGGDLTVDLDGDTGNDAFDLDYAGELDGVIHLDVHGGWDNDTLTADLNLQSGSSGRVGNFNSFSPAFVGGGAGDDLFRFAVFADPADGATVRVGAIVDGDLGFDRGEHTDLVIAQAVEQPSLLG